MHMAPELAYRPPTVQADVYSLGVVMLEIVSGKPSIDYNPAGEENRYLINTASSLRKQGRMLDLVDEKLSMTADCRSEAMTILNIAMQCLNVVPDSRPTMSEIVSELQRCFNIIPQVDTLLPAS
ncbi:hypothetical protein GH714_033625 [Hevea brasiliensis]|nr:hypothetical protein GH714_033625 [Hevea brasiliensis]